jgi:hypothetical protein
VEERSVAISLSSKQAYTNALVVVKSALNCEDKKAQAWIM